MQTVFRLSDETSDFCECWWYSIGDEHERHEYGYRETRGIKVKICISPKKTKIIMYPFFNYLFYGKRTSTPWWIGNSRRNRALKTWTGSRSKCSSKCFQRVSSQSWSSCVSSLRCCCWSCKRISRYFKRRIRRWNTLSIKNKSPFWGFFIAKNFAPKIPLQ